MLNVFARACAAISLTACAAFAQDPSPLLIAIGGDASLLRQQCEKRGWRLAAPQLPSPAWSDAAVRSLAETAADAPLVYLYGENEGAAAVFYAISRAPHLWTAAAAVNGSARLAIDTNKLYGANARLVPVLRTGPDADTVKLQAAGFAIEEQSASLDEALDWLARRKPRPFPEKVDCETGNPQFPRCYWVRMTRFDPAAKNDVLGSTRLAAGLLASLALSLQPGDRLISIAGKAPDRFLEEVTKEQPVAAIVQRGKERIRLETRTVLPKRDELVTVRVQAQFVGEGREIQFISRGATGIKFLAPAEWAPAAVNWNGDAAGSAAVPGCWELSRAEGAVSLAPCTPQNSR